MGKKDVGKKYPPWLVTIGMILLAAEVTAQTKAECAREMDADNHPPRHYGVWLWRAVIGVHFLRRAG